MDPRLHGILIADNLIPMEQKPNNVYDGAYLTHGAHLIAMCLVIVY